MTTNLQSLYKDVVESDLDEKLKFTFIALLETAVPENESIVQTKIKVLLSEYVKSLENDSDTLLDQADLLEKIAQLEEANKTVLSPSVSPLPTEQINTESIDQLRDQLDKISNSQQA